MPINDSLFHEKHGLRWHGSVETINLTFKCNLLSCWECNRRSADQHSGGTGNGVMEGWKPFVPSNMLVCNSSRLSYGSSISYKHELDEIRKPSSLLWCRRRRGIITSCWWQIPVLLSCILLSVTLEDFISYRASLSENESLLLAFWSMAAMILPATDSHGVVKRHARKWRPLITVEVRQDGESEKLWSPRTHYFKLFWAFFLQSLYMVATTSCLVLDSVTLLRAQIKHRSWKTRLRVPGQLQQQQQRKLRIRRGSVLQGLWMETLPTC